MMRSYRYSQTMAKKVNIAPQKKEKQKNKDDRDRMFAFYCI